jgi:hypothetical protein
MDPHSSQKGLAQKALSFRGIAAMDQITSAPRQDLLTETRCSANNPDRGFPRMSCLSLMKSPDRLLTKTNAEANTWYIWRQPWLDLRIPGPAIRAPETDPLCAVQLPLVPPELGTRWRQPAPFQPLFQTNPGPQTGGKPARDSRFPFVGLPVLSESNIEIHGTPKAAGNQTQG